MLDTVTSDKYLVMSSILPDFLDCLIVSGGIVGLTVVRALRNRYPAAKITELEKEELPSKHASGRNNGVLHRGIYYDSHTLKVKVCTEGACRMKKL
jgi:L-2-hydroxyglutarate oxidase